MSLENFKSFVRENPSLSNYVRNGDMTWQKFYELYNLYGTNNSVWNDYITPTTTANNFSFKGIFDVIKNIDMNEVQKGIGSLQKGIGYLQEFIATKEVPNVRKEEKEVYEPRPLYKYFDD